MSGIAGSSGGRTDGWWTEIEEQVERCLERNGGKSLAELARQLGLSEAAGQLGF